MPDAPDPADNHPSHHVPVAPHFLNAPDAAPNIRDTEAARFKSYIGARNGFRIAQRREAKIVAIATSMGGRDRSPDI